MDLDDRRTICELVAGILLADDELAHEELAFLHKIYARCGLGADEWDQLRPIPAGEASAALRALPPEVQNKVVALLVDGSIADGHVDPEERAYLLVAAAAMGIDADVLEQRISSRLAASR